MAKTPEFRDFTAREFQKVTEVAAFGRIGRPTVDRAIKAGELPARKFGRVLRVRTPDALRWLGIDPAEALERGAEGQK